MVSDVSLRAFNKQSADRFQLTNRYYVDLVPEPPRVTFIHPCDSEGKHPASAPANSREHSNTTRPRPVGPRKSSTASINPAPHDSIQRPRRATVAQQLYASSLNLGSRQSLQTSDSTSHRPQAVSSSPGPEDVAFNPTTYSSKKKAVSSTSSSLLNIDHHDPRKVFDCTRMAPSGIRRMTVNGTSLPRNLNLAPGPSPRDGRGYDAHELYHPSVSNSVTPSPILPRDTPDNVSRRSVLHTPPTQVARLQGSSSSRPSNLSSSALVPPLRGSATDVKSPQGSDTYSAVTEDGLLLVPKKASSLTPSSATTSTSPIDTSSSRHDASSSRPRIRISTDTGILQPKPIRPMKGVSLNLQVQAAVMTETREEDSVKVPENKRKSRLLKNFSLGISKGKAKVVIDPYSEDGSGYGDPLGTRFDDSFILVDSN